nr:creatininase family protein [Deltaproteobacteria bacterium]
MSRLADLAVLGTLEVGPPRLTARSLTVPYRISGRVSGEQATELRFRYHEDVFAPEDPSDRNLAAFLGAQLALNYGLFADRIVLRGLFDAADRSFLEVHLENTSREITANKLYSGHNVFLRPPADTLVPEVLERYSRATLVFPDATDAAPRTEVRSGSAFPAPVAVLASGGKDSLLTQGLLEELGCDVHALFVNESGRHWLTALEGWRHLSATRPDRTARVWTDCDRVFNWFNRRLPFIRPDFQRVRADHYPLRLWTVAIFLTAVLPLVRVRGLERIFVGDEFDTTRIETLRWPGGELQHYDGVYDQSRFFDTVFTSWYATKGWDLHQSSILRPLTELAIQLGLASRYPALLRAQVSCHAATVRGDRVVPCGRCEKCRRIIGCLVAGGADPLLAGYPPDVVDRCLEALAVRPMNQDPETSAHLRWLLQTRGRLGPTTLPTGPHPVALEPRFDPLCCPPDWLPEPMRAPVVALLD